jgi:tetratricopeptide (TPR) repeat protein
MFDLAKKNVDKENNLIGAVSDFKNVLAIEKNGKTKYSEPSNNALTEIKSIFLKSALEDNQNENYASASKKFKLMYDIDNEAENLYYAASLSTQAKDYQTALLLYNDLKTMGYTGEGTKYYAKNIASDTETVISSQKERDQFVKNGLYIDPRDEVIPSKKGEIFRNIALIYVQLGDIDKGINSLKEAKKENPEDITLLGVEIGLYAEINEKQKFEALTAEILASGILNSSIYNDMGLASKTFKDYKKAEEFYKKAIEIDVDNKFPYLNLAVMYIDMAADMLEEMNTLGTTAAENKKYDQLRKDREKAYENALPNLEKFATYEPENEGVLNTIKDIKRILE